MIALDTNILARYPRSDSLRRGGGARAHHCSAFRTGCMNFKLDENIGKRGTELLRSAGHNVVTFFARARINGGVVAWPNGAEIAPDAMYDEVRAVQHASV